MPDQLHIAALGSSFASGADIPPIIDSSRNCSGNNYAHIVTRQLDANLTDLSCSGATLLNVLDTPQELEANDWPAQVSQLPSHIDIVTLTAGGNDFGYSSGMITDAARASPEFRPYLSYLQPPSQQDSPSVEEVTRRFVAVIDAIRAKLPEAKVFLVEYPTIFGDHAQAGTKDIPFDNDRLEHHRDEAEKLRSAYGGAARQRPETKLVEIAKISMAHGVGSPEPWVCGFDVSDLLSGKAPYHPIARGHEEIAKILVRQIKEERS